jgi:ElaB/YqjD/DUF883 family membrane-anchored ribosome-binding protein
MLPNVLAKPVTVEDALGKVSKIKSVATDAIEDGLKSANRVIRRGRRAAEDVIEETTHRIKHRPLRAMGMVFAVGILVGGLAVCLGLRRR